MFSWKKTALVAGVLGSLAVAGFGVGVAEADDAPANGCTRSGSGVVCTYKSDVRYTTPDGRYAVHQSQDCQVQFTNRWVTQAGAVQDTGTTQQGPVVDCSNHAP